MGLCRGTIARRHLMRKALPPIVTMAGVDMAYVPTGLALVEYVFAWTGMGRRAPTAAQEVDLLYTRLDPRVRPRRPTRRSAPREG